MSTLFVTDPGQVTAIYGAFGQLPLTIFLDSWPGYPAIRAIMTSVSVQSNGNQQFLHTLEQYIYVYVFGERIGDLMLGGLLFTGACGPNPASTLGSGIEQLVAYYATNRLSKRGSLMTIQIGLTGQLVLQGFLVGHRSEIVDAAQQLGQFMLYFKTLTPEALAGAATAAG